MQLLIIVVVYNMQREAARTLFLLSTAKQIDGLAGDFEGIGIDNGSSQPLDAASVAALGPNFRYRFLETTSVYPAGAVNIGAAMAVGEFIAVIIDGARMATPGQVGNSLKAGQLFNNPFVCALSRHVGPDVQNNSTLQGYDRAE